MFALLLCGAAPAAAQCVGDCDGNGRVTIEELVRGVNIALNRAAVTVCPQFDRNNSGTVTVDELVAGVNAALRACPPAPTATPTNSIPTPTFRSLTSLQSSSPAHGEGDISVTRETILAFDGPLDAASVTDNAVFAQFGGNRLAVQRHLSTDRARLTLFYDPPLPGAARVRVTVDGDALRDGAGRRIDVDRDGSPGGTAQIDFDTLSLAPFPGTSVCGRIFASNPAPAETGAFVNVPLPGVRITVDGMEDQLFAVTDARGDFRLENVPAGGFFVHVDGLATTIAPPGAYYPRVGKMWVSVPGEETNVGEIYLPLITADTLVEVSATEETVIKVPPSVAEQFPDLADVRIIVPANSLYNESGQRGGLVGIAPVESDRIPSPLPPGLDLDIVITVQSAGGTDFDAPVAICFPNSENLAPGEKSALLSFNHDAGRWEVRGSMTVTPDGREVCTDPGVGITAPGWHGRRRRNRTKNGPINPGDDPQQEPNKHEPPACPDKKCPEDKKGDEGIGDPVYGFSGEFYSNVEDLRIPGRGIDFVWTRNYRSKIGPNTAQGNGWDFSYNVFLERKGADLTLCNGTGRFDDFRAVGVFFDEGEGAGSGPGTAPEIRWTKREFFQEMVCLCGASEPECRRLCGGTTAAAEVPQAGETPGIIQNFPGGGFWEFNLFDETTTEGKLRRSVDRHGNQMQFEYDTAGRLARIIDTLDRPIVVAYNSVGKIESVTDFIGRQVRYTYYGTGETGGSPGDLKTATTPAVTGTPNGNDFPNGKTWTYTYSTGFSNDDDALNHNLLTITDPKGQRYLTNIYGTTGVPREPADVVYDRVQRQIWGNPTDTIDFVYGHLTPDSSNNNAMQKTIVRDRVGNVKEFFYDTRNRLVMLREYTGRAATDAPTTETANRPTNKLRAADPPFFETRFEYNNDSQITRKIPPNVNVTEYQYESDIDGNAPPRKRGDLRRVRHMPGSYTPIGDQTVIEQRYEYDPRFGGLDFVTKHTDPRGNVTTHQYDANGNRVHTEHRLGSIVEDFEYNQFGQMTAHTLPDNGSGYRRRDELIYYSAGSQRGYLQNQIVDAATLQLTSTIEHDAVGNVVAVTDPRGHKAELVYNQLDQVVRAISPEVADASGIRYQVDTFYDANDNVIRTDVQNINDSGAVQANTHFTTTIDYEILNKPIRTTAEVDPSDNVVNEIVYDANRNPIRLRTGEATNGNQPANVVAMAYDERDLVLRTVRAPGAADMSTTEIDYDRNRNTIALRRGIEQTSRTSKRVYDSFDRLISATDPMGNITSQRYDANSNVVGVRFDGEITDVPGSGGNVRLGDETRSHDAMDRVTEVRQAFFDTTTQSTIADGVSTSRVAYSANSQIVRVETDNGHASTRTYDSANRLRTMTDVKGNSTTYTYDASSNVTSHSMIERSDLGDPDATFMDTFAYDNLNRLIRQVDNLGNAQRYGFDSRGIITRLVDAKGNVTRTIVDGLDRVIETIYELTTTGDSSGAPSGTIHVQHRYDDNSRLIAQIDDNDQATSYAYDALDRATTMTLADGTVHTTSYDVHDNPVSVRDANGTVVTGTYDLLDRIQRAMVTPGTNVSAATTFEAMAYDGLSRVVRAQDDDSLVTRRYDSLSNVVEEILDGRSTLGTYDAVGNALSRTYPGGRRIISTYDELERLRSITDSASGLIARYDYVGPGRLERREYGNGTQSTFAYDGSKRLIGTTHRRAGTILDDRSYAWDAAYHKTGRTDRLTNLVEAFRHDSIDRVIESLRTPATGSPQTTAYALDGVQNRTSVTGGADTGTYVRDATAPTPADRQVNQYSQTPFDMRRYDNNGNLTRTDGAGGPVDVAYDSDDRMVSYVAGATTATYRYDALGRRIERRVGNVSTRYLYDGNRVVEEQDGSGTTLATYVDGVGIDEHLQMRRAGQDYYFHHDDQGSVVALSDGGGSIAERYRYGDFGASVVTDAAGAPLPNSAVNNPYLFTGRRLDLESGWYDYRTRYLDPRAGRFTTRDSIGTWGAASNLGNAYAYVANDPSSYTDPLGMEETGMDIISEFQNFDYTLFWYGAHDTVIGMNDAVRNTSENVPVVGVLIARLPHVGTTFLNDASARKYGDCVANCIGARTLEAGSFGFLSVDESGKGTVGWSARGAATGVSTRAAPLVSHPLAPQLTSMLLNSAKWSLNFNSAGQLAYARAFVANKANLAAERPIVTMIKGQPHSRLPGGSGSEARRASLTRFRGLISQARGPLRSPGFTRAATKMMQRMALQIPATGSRWVAQNAGKFRVAGKGLGALGAGMYAADLKKCIEDCMKKPCPK